jgi:hypothetical protein
MVMAESNAIVFYLYLITKGFSNNDIFQNDFDKKLQTLNFDSLQYYY